MAEQDLGTTFYGTKKKKLWYTQYMWFPTSVTEFWTFFENYPRSACVSVSGCLYDYLKSKLFIGRKIFPFWWLETEKVEFCFRFVCLLWMFSFLFLFLFPTPAGRDFTIISKSEVAPVTNTIIELKFKRGPQLGNYTTFVVKKKFEYICKSLPRMIGLNPYQTKTLLSTRFTA